MRLAFELDGVSVPLEGADFSVHVQSGERVRRDAALRAPSATISGSVRFEGGLPVARAEVGATCLEPSGGWLVFQTVTNPRGEYALAVPDLTQSLELTAVVHDLSQARGGVSPGASGVDFVLSVATAARAVDAESGARPLPPVRSRSTRAPRQASARWTRTAIHLEGWLGTARFSARGPARARTAGTSGLWPAHRAASSWRRD